ncbi:MAG: bifunctional 4-hydroxy-2-oxoglutarate aldolase/2-dehydro-3-deoxy-phosphogluconate aldolase [Cyanobacteriota bacterium]|nr:bifunctional 4-hydroxy-2-oxoglutarate aldolase/2-dehydro-3-deoxy-phosphogluconate aldolase [Cyanobacteriota bacterium]
MTSRWPPTSEGEALIASLRRQPLLLVFRPKDPLRLAPLLERLRSLGLFHVEIACQPSADWSRQCRELGQAFPELRLGGASIVNREGLRAVIEAGLTYGVSPILERRLQREAAAARFPLVPGAMTPSEIWKARQWGPGLVKLFPAAPLGATYWSRLRDPLGGALPFCIAAGGLGLEDVGPWLAAGVDAVAVGSRWLANESAPGEEALSLQPLRALLAQLSLQM